MTRQPQLQSCVCHELKPFIGYELIKIHTTFKLREACRMIRRMYKAYMCTGVWMVRSGQHQSALLQSFLSIIQLKDPELYRKERSLKQYRTQVPARATFTLNVGEGGNLTQLVQSCDKRPLNPNPESPT